MRDQVQVVCFVLCFQVTLLCQAPAWTLVSQSGPSPRAGHAMAFDSQRGKTILFGGYGVALHGDTFEFDGTAWAQVVIPGPSPRARHAMVYDSQRGKIVLFGGEGPANLGDTWEFDGAAWTLVTVSGPPPRANHALAFDANRGRVVLFGGTGSSGALGDTWEWNGLTWTPRLFAAGPSARVWHAMAFNSQRGRTILHGGGGSNGTLSDTWEWDGVAWTPIGSSQGRIRHCMVYDAAHGKILMFGGFFNASLADTLELASGGTWNQVLQSGPSARGYHAMAYDSQRGKTILFGGGTNGYAGLLGDTWELDMSPSTPSASIPFGQGCGSPALNLATSPTAMPVVGTTAQVDLSNVPLPLSYILIGWNRSNFGPFSLPLPLAGYGLPGCELVQSSDVHVSTVPAGAGAATYSLALPNWTGLLGIHLYLQAWSPAPGQNAGGVIVSNGVEWVIGDV